MSGVETLDLARIQFAFTVSFHILFPSITIGLASYLMVLEGLWLKTKQTAYRDLYHFWAKIFAVSFGMGVVSGIVMAFQFGTNWSRFSDFGGSITGPLLTYEVLTAFFLEAGFLGVMLFGWKKVGPGLHFLSTCMVAAGTLISTFWILASNSWMQTPQGHEIINGTVVPVDWIAVMFTPSFPYRMVHMVTAAYLTTAFIVAAAAAWHLLRGRDTPAVRTMFSMALWMALIVTPIQIYMGDLHGLNTLEHQPAKVAAIEGHWENVGDEPTPLILVGWPDMEQEKTHFAVKIPALGSIILTHSLDKQIPALKDFPPEDRAPVALVFWAFRLMVALGVLMLVAGLWSAWLRCRGRLYASRSFQRYALLMGPSGLLAVLAGWFTTEVGRQPWMVYGLQRTADAVSMQNPTQMSVLLVLFVVIYFIVFGTGIGFLLKLINRGPEPGEIVGDDDRGTPSRPMSAAELESHTPTQGR